MKKLKLFTLMLSLILLFSGCGTIAITDNPNNTTPTTTTSSKENSESNESSIKVTEIPSTTYDAWLKVHFIDVGQGDATLIESNGHFMLIDAGENNQANVVISYLKQIGVQKLERAFFHAESYALSTIIIFF